MTENKPITVYTADCIGNAINCRYPNEVNITDEVTAKQAFSKDMVCARYKNCHRSVPNFETANALPMDCDNDHSDIPADWITPEDVAEFFADVPYVLHFSRHHEKPKGGKGSRPRFHIVFRIDPEQDVDRYTALKKRLLAVFPFFDANATDAARFLFGTENPKVIYHPGTISLNAFLDARENEQAFADLGRTIPEGSRNSTMSQIGARIIKRYGDTLEAKNLFLQAAEQCTPPLDEQELERIWVGKQRLYTKIVVHPGVFPEECMSFPAFKFMDLLNQEWDESDVYEQMVSARFLFVVFSRPNRDVPATLQTAFFWNMPAQDVDEVHRVWDAARASIRRGADLVYDGRVVKNSLPKQADSPIAHVRPHANKAAYILADGTVIGNPEKDANELPDGQWMTTQSFWFSKEYTRNIILQHYRDKYV